MNLLQYQTSPYLLQHAANPVHWHPWGEAALAKARKEDKPILVSIGYSTCHWCHVMEHESFEDEQVAAYMNEHFVCIKVDREERPDVDQVYMEACQAISGGGGWPLNAFLLPDTRPFYAGTYFPPESRYNRPSWMDVLYSLSKNFRENRSKLESQAEHLTSSIAKSSELFIKPLAEGHYPFAPAQIEQMLLTLRGRFDTTNGGFGGAPKFPMSQSLELLLEHGILTDNQSSLSMAHIGMEAMIRGGIYDQLGGGFSRYTVDAGWHVPHFEKMLYDNGLLLKLLGKLHLQQPTAVYETTMKETIGWLEREMLSPSGSFYAALDADSEGVEGKFYVWNYADLKELLSSEQLELMATYYGTTEAGNWEEEHTNILFRAQEVPTEAEVSLASIKEILFQAREKRIRPGRDEKIILQWNALMISGLCYCFRATGKTAYQTLASNALHAIRQELRDEEGRWYRNYKDNQRGHFAYLDDYAALIGALLDVYDTNFDNQLLVEALELTSYVRKTFGDAPGGLFYLRPPAGSELPVATVDLYDNALPSGNSQLLDNMQRLGQLVGDTELLEAARTKLTSVVESVQKYPSSFAGWARLALHLSVPARELVITGPGSKAAAAQLLKINRPDVRIVVAETETVDFPSLKNRYLSDQLQFFLCENQSCRLPVHRIEDLVGM